MKLSRIGAVAFLTGLLFCIILALIPIHTITVTIILLVLGLIVGFLNIKDKDTNQFLLASIVLIATSATPVGDLPVIGAFLQRTIFNFASFVGPAALVVSIYVIIKIANFK
jgi:hypothetical protein